MEQLTSDINLMFEQILNNCGKEKYDKFLKKDKNLILLPANESQLGEKKQILLYEQLLLEEKVKYELNKFDSFNIPFIGIKGYFLKKQYYGNINRIFSDIDILVKCKDARKIYKSFYECGYKIKTKTLYDNPHFNIKFIPELYMQNTQTLMLKNKSNRVSIDMHSNLNITNAHFTNYNTRFNTEVLFKNSMPFENYKNIRQLETHDHLCFLIKHLLKHHVFYAKTQSGLHTALQYVMDLAVIINSDGFDDDILFKKASIYNIIPETLFCISIYNRIFTHCHKIDIGRYINELKKQEQCIHWEKFLFAVLEMPIEDVIIGDFSKCFPRLQTAVEYSQSMPNRWIDWFIEGFIINPIINKLTN